jgi:hypothetical protein
MAASRGTSGPVKGVAAFGCLLFCIPLLVLLSPFIAFLLAWEEWRAGAQRRQFARVHGPEVRGILIYSNSPNWQQYIEQHWLPRIGPRLVVVNWSERARWKDTHPLEAAIFRRHLGDREFNPAAIVFRPLMSGRLFRRWLAAIRALDPLGMLAPYAPSADVVRFFQPFRDYKHGKERALQAAEAELWRLLEEGPIPHVDV